MKYEKVATRSTTTMHTAARYQTGEAAPMVTQSDQRILQGVFETKKRVRARSGKPILRTSQLDV
jgi:hypothetical protein